MKRVTVSYVMNVLNGEPFLSYQLASIYPYAHQIVIVEGAYRRFAHAATADGHSVDRTREVLAAFPDPEQKLVVISRDGYWEDRCEMCNAFLPAVTGDVMWQVDTDEFYLPWVHERVVQWFAEDNALDRVSFRVREFFASPEYEVCGGIHAIGLGDVRRVHRFHPGVRWLTQRPPTLGNATGVPQPIRRERLAEDTVREGMRLFHYTTLFRRQITDKFRYYRQMWANTEQDEQWLHETWDQFTNPLRLHGAVVGASWIERYDGPWPLHVEDMMRDVQTGMFSGLTVRGREDIERYLASAESPEDVAIAQALNEAVCAVRTRHFFLAARPSVWVLWQCARHPFRRTYRFCARRVAMLVVSPLIRMLRAGLQRLVLAIARPRRVPSHSQAEAAPFGMLR